MLNLVIFGAPGSGKGTQSERIIDRYGLYHISTGEVLRDQIARGTQLGKLADKYISQGHLIPDDLMVKVLADEIDSHPDEVSRGIIFDGFPRTIPQAEELTRLLKERGTEVHAVIGLEVEDTELIERMLKRGRDTGRADDNPDTIKERLNVYHSQTQPLREYYHKQNKFHPVPGSGSVDHVFSHISCHLDNIDTESSSNANI